MAQDGLVHVEVDNGAAVSTTIEIPGPINLSGNTWTLTRASYRQLTAIAADATYYYTLAVHVCTAAGVHTVVAATATLTAVALTAYVPLDLTLGAAGDRVVIDSSGINCLATKVGSAPNLDAGGRWTLEFAQS